MRGLALFQEFGAHRQTQFSDLHDLQHCRDQHCRFGKFSAGGLRDFDAPEFHQRGCLCVRHDDVDWQSNLSPLQREGERSSLGDLGEQSESPHVVSYKTRGGRMIIILFLIPLSILIGTIFLVAFIWAVRSGQYEDTSTPSMRLLLEDKTEGAFHLQKQSQDKKGEKTVNASVVTMEDSRFNSTRGISARGELSPPRLSISQQRKPKLIA